MSTQETSQREHRFPPWWVFLRDVLTFVGGWVVTFHEVSRPEVRESVLVFAGTVLATPGLAVARQALTDVVNQRRGGTPEPPSSPQVEAVSP